VREIFSHIKITKRSVEQLCDELCGWLAQPAHWRPLNSADAPNKASVPRLVNVVSTARLVWDGAKPDLRAAALSLPHAKKNATQFASLRLCYEAPRCSVLVFPTGMMLCVGASTISLGVFGLHRAFTELAPIYRNLRRLHNFEVSNLVQTGRFPFCINIAEFVARYSNQCTYTPGRFSGCTYRPQPGGVSAVLFEGGSWNMMGMNSFEEAAQLYHHLREIVPEFEMLPRSNIEFSNIVAIREAERLAVKRKYTLLEIEQQVLPPAKQQVVEEFY
jgi:transcription initiation factor TFIID TATA-box-binding protein